MKKILSCFFVSNMFLLSIHSFADGFVSGVPVAIQKTDYGSKHLIFIKLDSPIGNNGCDSGAGVVVHDANESSKAALSLAMTAFAAGKKFSCYVVTNQCSSISGADTTYPVCVYYPSITN